MEHRGHNEPSLKPLLIDPLEKVRQHVDVLFGHGVAKALPDDLQFEYSRKTGRIKNFSIGGHLVATLRTDGGLALTVFGAQWLLAADGNSQFMEHCVIPFDEAIPFVTEGRSLFCKHVEWCGQKIAVGSEVSVIDKSNKVIAVGVAMLGSSLMRRYGRGVAVKMREGLSHRREGPVDSL